MRSYFRSRLKGGPLALMSAATLALGTGATAAVPASADTAGLDGEVVAITGIATLDGTPAFPCSGNSNDGFPADGITCPATFSGNCVAGASLSVPRVPPAGEDDVTSIVGARVGSTGVGDGCGAVNNSGGIAYWEPSGGGLGTAQGALVINETSGDVGDGDTFTAGFDWFRVGLAAAVVMTSICESPCVNATDAGAAAAIFVPGVAFLGDSTCLPTSSGCPGPWRVFIASVGAYLPAGSD
jgi:hypothetical protein